MIHKPKLVPPIFVDTAAAFAEMLRHLQRAPIVAVDTESNSLYAYTERVCLLQFSIPGQDYLLDPLAVDDIAALGDLFAAPEIEKVFHAAEYDVMVLHRDHGFAFENLFDTMVASRIVGWQHYGLGKLLQEHFGIATDKRMQRTNWGRRPLSPEQLAYAQLDTHFLLRLRGLLLDELMAQDRVVEARAAFARLTASRWNGKPFDPNGFWRIKGVQDLDDVGRAVLRELYIYRDRRARALDRPPFKVLNDSVLVTLGRRQPQTLRELSQIKGLPRRLSDKRRRHLLDVIARARENPPPRRPHRDNHGRLSEAAENRYERLRLWRKTRAQARGVEPDVILSNHILYQLARRNPTSLSELDESGVLNDWERQMYGPEVVDLINRR